MDAPKTKKKETPAKPALIVGVGASAGGMESLQMMLSSLPDDCTISFVILIHVDPTANDLIPDIISKHTKLKVREISNGMAIEAGTVYTAPGHQQLTIKNNTLYLDPADRAEDRRAPIDKFFHSLAKDQGERAVAIVLSGTGSDGALGLKSVSKAGGMALAQAPSTAKYEEMPQSAIDTGSVDHVLSPAALTEELMAYAEHMKLSGEKETFEALLNEVSNLLPEICEVLLNVTGHNFRHYKVSTLSRRVQRRIQVLRINTAREYLERLKADEEEVNQLFNDLLIGVTAFFRDPDAFESLASDIFPRLFRNRRAEDTIRIWVPGCATGEEAYTIAMLLREHLDNAKQAPEVQIFATDIDEQALSTARAGAYPLGITEEIRPERLKRFFIKKGQQYHINKEIRAMVLFSVHNLINDPPFSKLDMISCRNLLIYLGSHLQKKLIPLFHYALKPGGFLFLGPSENLSSHRELFRPIAAKHRISQRLPTAVQASAFMINRNASSSSAVKPPNVANITETDTYLLMQRIVLDEFAPKSVVVDQDGQIICASGNLEKYLTVSTGAFHNSVTRLAREGLRVGIRATLAEAIEKRRQITHDGLSLRTEEGLLRIRLTVQPMPHLGDDSGLYLIVFQDMGTLLKEETVRQPATEEAAALIDHLERELLSTREDLECTVQDLEAANEEMKSSNEELLSMNEELQSANEELETSKEEIQATNDTLTRVNNDLENLLASTRLATLFLDDTLHVRRATPMTSEIYNLLPSDMGRPLSHFTHKAKHMPSLPDIKTVKTTKRAIEDEIEMQNGAWYIRRVLPYLTQDGQAEGLVVTFTEVTERKRAELTLRENEEHLRLAMSAANLGDWKWKADDDSVKLSPRAAEIFGVTDKTRLTRHDMRDSLLHPEDQPIAHKALEKALATKTDYFAEYRLKSSGSNPTWVQATGRAEYNENGKLVGMLGVVKDITEQKLAVERLKSSEQMYRAIGESINYGVWVCEPSGKNTYASESFLNLVGMTQEQCSEFGWSEVLHPDERDATMTAWKECAKEGGLWDREHRFKGKDGKWHPVLARGIPVRNDKGEITCWAGINLDISSLKRAESALTEKEQRFRTMADQAPVLIWISDVDKKRIWFNKPWLEFTGRSMENELGDGWMDNVHPDDLVRFLRVYRHAFDSLEPFRIEYRLRRHDGEYRWLMANAIPMKEGDSFIGYVGTCTDVTNHKLSEIALKEADRRKDEFLATLAHELRNPLAPISNGLQVLRKAASRPELLERTQSLMERQVHHMVRLVDDLLDVSRITRGKIELHKETIDISDIVYTAVEISEPLITEKKHTLKTSLPKKSLFVHCDPTRLSQVIANLLNNSAKYTPEGGKIELEVTQKKDDMILSIKDNGIGIPANMLSSVFDMFVQVDTALERSHGGLGIGLTLVKKLVELHGGRVEVKSSGKDKGSEFIVRLPLSPDAS
ncbi:MAG: CheR family methyltransferase [Rickettsiales bacterium]